MVVSKINPYNKQDDDSSVNKLTPLDMLDRLQQVKEQTGAARTISQMLEETDPYERGMSVVADALSRAGQTSSFSKVFDKKVKSELEKEFADLKDTSLDDIDDQALLSKIAQTIQRKQDLKGTSSKRDMPVLDQETSDFLQQYLHAYAGLVATDSPLLKKRIDELEQRLMQRGVSQQNLLGLKLSLKASLRGEIVQLIKDAFTKRVLSQEMVVEWGMNTRSLNNILDLVWNSKELGGKEFGGYQTDLQGAMDQVVDDTNREMRTFLTEALKAKMTEKLVGTNEKVTQELKDLLQVAGRIGFDLDAYVKQWQKDKINEGLFIFNAPQDQTLLNLGTSTDQQQGKYKPPEESTEEMLVNRLRALYLRKALRDDWLTSINTQFKIRRVKNGMLRLGIYSNDVNEQVQSEANTIAQMKIMEMIKEALLERATLYRLEGPAYTLITTKLTGLLRNAKRLEMDITEEDFNALRDNADRTVFEVSKRELRLTTIASKATNAPFLATKKQKLVQLLGRLKDEAGIQDDLGISVEDERDVLQMSV